MTTTSLPASSPTQIAGRFGFTLVLLANALRMSWDDGRTSSLDVVLWTGLAVVGLYGGALLVSALADRPLSYRIYMQLEGLGLLIILAVASWSVVVAARSQDWVVFSVSAVVAVVNGLLLWVVARQIRRSPHRA